MLRRVRRFQLSDRLQSGDDLLDDCIDPGPGARSPEPWRAQCHPPPLSPSWGDSGRRPQQRAAARPGPGSVLWGLRWVEDSCYTPIVGSWGRGFVVQLPTRAFPQRRGSRISLRRARRFRLREPRANNPCQRGSGSSLPGNSYFLANT